MAFVFTTSWYIGPEMEAIQLWPSKVTMSGKHISQRHNSTAENTETTTTTPAASHKITAQPFKRYPPLFLQVPDMAHPQLTALE